MVRRHESSNDYRPTDEETQRVLAGFWALDTERQLVGTFAGVYHGPIPDSAMDRYLDRHRIREERREVYKRCWGRMDRRWRTNQNRHLKKDS